MGMGQSLVFSTLPPIARSLGMSPMQISLIFASSALCWVFMSPRWGRKSDQWGRKPAMLIGFAGFILSMAALPTVVYMGSVALLPITWVWPLMIVSRVIFGIFGSANMPAATAWVADRSPRSERAKRIAAVGAAFGVGSMVGPGFGSLLSAFGMLTPFYAVSLLAIAGAVAIQWYLPEAARPQTPPGASKTKAKLKYSDSRVLPFMVLTVVAGLAHATQVQSAALYFQDTLLLTVLQTQQYVGVGLMATAMMAMFAQLILVQRLNLSPKTMIYSGLFFTIVGYLLYIVAASFTLLVIAMMFTGLGQGLFRPGTSAGASLSVGREEQGAVAGMMGGVGAAGHIIVPFVSMNLYAVKPEHPYIFTVVLLLMVLVYALKNHAVRRAGRGLAKVAV
ncbi:MAG: MFS family permease [Paraglaciecola psychrophila]|jgi:MFS family permease